ncbi:MAG TPA: GNAT family N-acetyltransferase [Acidimicrobiales bacterium]|nr:GNAT family N-acetyltransferase [Acidimicrobiales bacterium]
MRPATDADAASVIYLVRACFSEYEGCVLDTDKESPHLLRVASHYAEAQGGVWVAERQGTVVGSVACRPAAGAGILELQLLYVAASERRKGLATTLVGLVEAEAVHRGLQGVELWTDTRFLDAHRLYEGLGYRRLPGWRALEDLSDSLEYHFVKGAEAGLGAKRPV